MKSNKMPTRQDILAFTIESTQTKKLLIRSILAIGLIPGLSIAAQAQITTGGDGTLVKQTGNTIDITGGTPTTGGNLFHSFKDFGVKTAETANFVSNPSITNILGRVSGGNPSTIDGKIQVSGGNANLYLMNPAGIVFGKGASLDINGAFTATTAKAIDFGNGNWFNALGTNTYGNLNGNPIGLAFPGNTPGSIFSAATFDGSDFKSYEIPVRTKQTIKPGQSITLVGGTVISTGDIKTAGGNISIATVEGGKYVQIKTDGSILRLDLPASATNITPQAKAFTAVSLPQLLTATGVDLAATGVKNENGVLTLVGNPAAVAAVKVSADKDNFFAIQAATAVGDPDAIASDINLGDTISKQNRLIFGGDVITRNLDTSNINKGGNIHIKSSQAILSHNINTNSERSVDKANQIYRSGNVVLDAQTELKTQRINSSSVPSNNGSIKNTTGGKVTLSTQTKDIIVDSIYTTAGNDENSNDPGTRLTKAQSTGFLGGDVTIKSAGLFRVIDGGINTSLFGVIDIEHGSKQPFASGVTGEPKGGGGSGPSGDIPGFTFPDGASGSRGGILTSQGTNGSIGVIYKDQSINGITIKGTTGNTNTVVSKPDPKSDDNTNDSTNSDKNNTDNSQSETQIANQKSDVKCDQTANSSSTNQTTSTDETPNTSAAYPCNQNVNGTTILQILNSKKSK